MQIGGVTVFGLPADMPIWVDARVMDRDRIILGGGSRSWKVISTAAILEALPGMVVVDGLATEPRPDA
jgi:prolyl-tRNA editing enzyme YbaK/EbsC (Cys-tRNA(Pro) deacylase)